MGLVIISLLEGIYRSISDFHQVSTHLAPCSDTLFDVRRAAPWRPQPPNPGTCIPYVAGWDLSLPLVIAISYCRVSGACIVVVCQGNVSGLCVIICFSVVLLDRKMMDVIPTIFRRNSEEIVGNFLDIIFFVSSKIFLDRKF